MENQTKSVSKQIVILASAAVVLLASGCASGRFKQRKEARDKLAVSTKMYCDFVSNEVYPDVEVQLSLDMGKKCDPDRPFSISSMKNVNDNLGVLYCCNLSATAKLIDDEGGKKTAVAPASAPLSAPASGTPSSGGSSN